MDVVVVVVVGGVVVAGGVEDKAVAGVRITALLQMQMWSLIHSVVQVVDQLCNTQSVVEPRMMTLLVNRG